MVQYTLTVVDTARVQSYIFGSNNLKHNIGASELVYRATHDWAFESMVELGESNVNAQGAFNDRTIDGDSLVSELIYAGGGNVVALFKSHESAVAFAKALTRRVLLEAPGMQLVVAHTDFDWESKPLAQVVEETRRSAGRKKQDRSYSLPLLGLGVTAECQFTGLPASGVDQEGRRISSEIQAKLDAVGNANQRLKLFFPDNSYSPVEDFDEIGTKGESSYIAVIHTDGNGMGKRIQRLAKRFSNAADNRAYIAKMREFSRSVNEAAVAALQATVGQLITAIDSEGKIGGVVPVKGGKLPFRPIVFGGDDVTFVCDGRLGLTLTAFYLKELTSSSHPLPDDDTPIDARAGIAVVKTHYPFARAYALADELAGSAKEYIKGQSQSRLTAMDWHFAVGGLVLELKEIRKREYTVEAGHLTMRPVRLEGPVASDWHSWEVFSKIVTEFLNGPWAEKRNKVKALRDALRDGPDATKQFLYLNRMSLPDIVTEVPILAETGWEGKVCGYFDPIEALDFFVPL